jgi:membrane fusion protein, multidrug efflux system
MPVRTQTVSIVSHPHTESLTGEYRARVQSDLSFRIGGRISSRMVDVGDRVKTGDLLATIDSLQQTADVTAAVAALRSAEASLQQAAANARRIESLLPSQSATQSEFDDAKAAELTAQGSINISKSVLATAENQLSFTELRAPASGVIIARDAEVGQVVSAAQKVFTLAVDGEREAVFDAFQRHVSERPIDDKVELVLVSNPDVKAAGVIREIAPSIDRNNGTVRVKVAIPNPPDQMTLGAPVMGIARFLPTNVVQLPWTALARQGNSPAVWVVDPNTQQVTEREVVVESYESGELLITSGLQAGEVVVTEGTQLIRPGQKIKSLNQTMTPVSPGAAPGSASPQETVDPQSPDNEGAKQP